MVHPGDLALEVEGPAVPVAALVQQLRSSPPAPACVEAVDVEPLAPTGGSGFVVTATTTTVGTDVRVSTDVAPCAACLATELASTHEVDTVALSGGVFQDVLLTDLLAAHLRRAGLRVLLHEHLPPNDDSISVGQAAVAAAHLERGEDCP